MPALMLCYRCLRDDSAIIDYNDTSMPTMLPSIVATMFDTRRDDDDPDITLF